MHDLATAISEFLGDVSVATVPASATVAEAAEALRSNNAGCVLIEQEGKLAGIFTERDYLRRVAAPGLASDATRVGEVMTAGPESLLPIDEIAWAINKMAVGGYRNIPVVDTDEKPLGAIGAFDVIDFLDEALEESLASRDDEEQADADEHHWTDVGGG